MYIEIREFIIKVEELIPNLNEFEVAQLEHILFELYAFAYDEGFEAARECNNPKIEE